MLTDLSLVTQALLRLIEIRATLVMPVTVSSLPPDKLSGDNTIGLYLYHITENAQYKNLPPMSSDDPPIRYTPMGLDLHYLLTGHSDPGDDNSVHKEQTMLGLAMKALHDYPVVDNNTEVGGTNIFQSFLGLQQTENRFRVVLQPLQDHDVTNYWTGTQPLRLAAYYQVSVVLLEPELPMTRAGRVLSYGVFSFTRGAAHLDASKSVVSFTAPGETSPRAVEVKPAQVSIGGQVVLLGSDLAGDQTALLINGPNFDKPIEVDTSWAVTASENQIVATVQETVQSPTDTKTIVPGMYSVVAKVVMQRLMPDKTWRDFSTSSNQTPFAVVPRIQQISVPDANLTVAVTGGVFKNQKGITPDAVEVFVGPQRLAPKAGNALNAGEYEVPDSQTLNFRYPITGLSSGATVPFRLIINGAESGPNWVNVP